MACSYREELRSPYDFASWAWAGGRFGQAGSADLAVDLASATLTPSSVGATLTLRIHLTPVSSSGLAPGCGTLQSPLWNGGTSARLSSAMGYIGPCWDVLGQRALMAEDYTGVTSVPGG
jgi:hypothetical protein